ncbi:hypothetical protein JXB41_08340 [Candidatus Woesearchaeota archaeon]|nr:hypothetical protein [Candidatus Woesearchaeota archaeon]
MVELCKSIEDYYDTISTNVKLYRKKRTVGEIDVLAKKGKFFDIFEVKCSHRITKARKQKKKFLRHAHINIRNIWFYCGATAEMVLL